MFDRDPLRGVARKRMVRDPDVRPVRKAAGRLAGVATRDPPGSSDVLDAPTSGRPDEPSQCELPVGPCVGQRRAPAIERKGGDRYLPSASILEAENWRAVATCNYEVLCLSHISDEHLLCRLQVFATEGWCEVCAETGNHSWAGSSISST